MNELKQILKAHFPVTDEFFFYDDHLATLYMYITSYSTNTEYSNFKRHLTLLFYDDTVSLSLASGTHTHTGKDMFVHSILQSECSPNSAPITKVLIAKKLLNTFVSEINKFIQLSIDIPGYLEETKND